MLDADDDHRRGRKSPWAAEVDGFNIHAGVLIHGGDREGLERLCRYGARPPFSLERISLLTDGRVAYLLKKPRSNGATHLVMTPVQFLARIATLIPPPRFSLQRFSGVLAPNSSWRPSVVAMRPATPTPSSAAEPRPAAPRLKKLPSLAPPVARARDPSEWLGAEVESSQADVCPRNAISSDIARREPKHEPTSRRPAACHRTRAGKWPLLGLSARCGGKLTVRAVLTDPAVIAKRLHALRRPRAPPAAA